MRHTVRRRASMTNPLDLPLGIAASVKRSESKQALLIALVDNLQGLRPFGRRGQILVSIGRDQNVVLDPHASNGVVLIQQGAVDIFAEFGGFEVYLFESVAMEVS
jgi:hypothetical protein